MVKLNWRKLPLIISTAIYTGFTAYTGLAYSAGITADGSTATDVTTVNQVDIVNMIVPARMLAKGNQSQVRHRPGDPHFLKTIANCPEPGAHDLPRIITQSFYLVGSGKQLKGAYLLDRPTSKTTLTGRWSTTGMTGGTTTRCRRATLQAYPSVVRSGYTKTVGLSSTHPPSSIG